MAQARSNPMYAQEDADDVAPPTPAFSTGVQPAVAFRSDLTPHSERRGGAGGGTAGGGTRFAYWDQGGDPHGFGNDSQGRGRSLTHVNAGATIARANMRLMTVEDDTAPITVEDEAMDYYGNLVENGAEQLAVEEMGVNIVEIQDENMPWGFNGRYLYSSNSHGPLPHRSGFLHQHGMTFAPPVPPPMASNYAAPQFHRVPQSVDMNTVNVVSHTYENDPGSVRGAVGTGGVNEHSAERAYDRRRRR